MWSADIAERGHFIMLRLDCIGNYQINILKTLYQRDVNKGKRELSFSVW